MKICIGVTHFLKLWPSNISRKQKIFQDFPFNSHVRKSYFSLSRRSSFEISVIFHTKLILTHIVLSYYFFLMLLKLYKLTNEMLPIYVCISNCIKNLGASSTSFFGASILSEKLFSNIHKFFFRPFRAFFCQRTLFNFLRVE